MSKANFYTIANNAVFSATIDNKSRNFLQAFDYLFLTLAAQKRYTEADKQIIIEDFYDMYGLKINSMFAGEFIGRLTSQKFIYKDPKTKTKYFQRNKIDALNLLEGLQRLNDETSLFVKTFVDFGSEQRITLTEERAQDIIVTSIEENVCGILTGIKESVTNFASQDRYLFAMFLERIKEFDIPNFETYKKITLGRIFSSVIANNGITVENNNFIYKNLKIYLDSSFVFNALDMDLYGTSQEYLEMIKTLQEQGAKLFLFNHVFYEIRDLVENAAKWIDNSDFDETIASRTAIYFVKTRKTKEEAQNILYSLERKICSLGIHIEETNIDYNNNENDILYEENIYQQIIDTYKRNNYLFDQTKEETYRNDARSLFAIYKLRGNRSIKSLKDANYVFITNNYSICAIANEIQQRLYQGDGVPFAINSKLLNVLLWFSSDKYSDEANKMFLIPAAYHSFQPSLQLLKKLDIFLKSMREKNLLTDAEVLDWKSDLTLTKEILEETKNNAENFTEETTIHVIEKLKNHYALSMEEYSDLKVKKTQLENLANERMKRIKIISLIIAITILIGLVIGFYFLFSGLFELSNLPAFWNEFIRLIMASSVGGLISLITFIFKSKKKPSIFQLFIMSISNKFNTRGKNEIKNLEEKMNDIKSMK